MNKLIPITLLGAVLFASPAMSADSSAVQQDTKDIEADQGAIQKDNAALSQDQKDLAANRARNDADKANGSYGSQAVDNVKIGADHTKITEKEGERSVDQKILQHH